MEILCSHYSIPQAETIATVNHNDLQNITFEHMHETNVKPAVIPQTKRMSSLMMADYRLKPVAINMAHKGRVSLNLNPLS
jgi:hypothetical protein